MTSSAQPVTRRNKPALPPMLGGFAALAESAWMGIVQVGGRAVLMALLLGQVGVVAIPAALGIMATLETNLLLVVLMVKLRRRLNSETGQAGQGQGVGVGSTPRAK